MWRDSTPRACPEFPVWLNIQELETRMQPLQRRQFLDRDTR